MSHGCIERLMLGRWGLRPYPSLAYAYRAMLIALHQSYLEAWRAAR